MNVKATTQGPLLKVRTLNANVCSVNVPEGCKVADLKKLVAEELGIRWWQQQWTSTQDDGSLLANDCSLDVSQVQEVTCIAMLEPCFPLDSGKFNHLVVTGVVGDPVFAEPDEDGRLIVAGMDFEEDEIDDAVVLEDRLLTIKGDGECEQDDPDTTAAWSEEVKLDTEGALVIVGWRVRYISSGWPGPCFGLTTRQHLTTNVGTNSVTEVLKFSPQEMQSEVSCSPTSFNVGSIVQKVNGEWLDGCEGTVVEIVDGKHVIVAAHSGEQLRDVDASGITGAGCCLKCTSSFTGSGGEEVGLPTNDVGGFEYDVLVAFDSFKKEVRASVGWGGAGSRIDKVVVPSTMWPSSDLPLIPFVSLDHEDFFGMNNVGDRVDQLPITIEALSSKQMAEEAICALLQG